MSNVMQLEIIRSLLSFAASSTRSVVGSLPHAMVSITSGSFWLPEQASTSAETIDFVYWFIYYISLFFAVAIGAAIVILVFRFKRKNRDEIADRNAPHHSNTLEITWSIIPALLCVAMFYLATVGFMDLRTAPQNAEEVTVHGWKWAWEYEYANGATASVLHAVKGEPTKLLMYSDDVIHSFFVPAFRVKQDVVPGRYSSLWFTPTVAGEHQVFCTEYCGTSHSDMLSTVMVHETREQYEEALKKLGNKYEGLSLADAGAAVYKAKGCATCHSVDGSKLVGPSFKGTWGSARKFQDGTEAQADENYIRNSVLYPQKQVVAGYPPVMPTYKGQLSDDEVGYIIAYIKSLK